METGLKVNHETEDPVLACEDDVLVFQILPKLPVKSLFRFKSVCKKWLQWISEDPSFIREQSRISLASYGILYMGFDCLEFVSASQTQTYIPDPPLKFMGRSGFVSASCNGLLCISGFRQNLQISVCNPVTRELHLVPKTKHCMPLHWISFRRIGLAFDPLVSPQSYKLVCPYIDDHLEEEEGEGNRCFEFGFTVFSSDTCEWMESKEKVILKDRWWIYARSAFAGGILYWTSSREIVWFDTKKGLAGFLSPPADGLEGKDPALGVCEDRLMYTRIVNREMTEVWIMSGCKWKRIYQVSLYSAMHYDLSLIQRWEKHGEVLPYHGGEFLYTLDSEDRRSFKVLCYNMKSGEATKLNEYAAPALNWSFYPHNNSLVRIPKLSSRVG